MLAVAVVVLVIDSSDIVYPVCLIYVDCIDFCGLIQESEETQPIYPDIRSEQLMLHVWLQGSGIVSTRSLPLSYPVSGDNFGHTVIGQDPGVSKSNRLHIDVY